MSLQLILGQAVEYSRIRIAPDISTFHYRNCWLPRVSAALGEEPPANPLTGKSSSPSVKNRALGEGFAECRAGTRGRLDAVGRRPTPFFLFSSPSATLGKDF